MWNWIKKLFKTSNVIDASDVAGIDCKTYINSDGHLMFTSFNYNGKVNGLCEWNNSIKKLFEVDENKTVIDFLCEFTNLKSKAK